MPIPWADQPFPLLSAKLPEGHKSASPGSLTVFMCMTLAHNTTIRHLNAIHLQAMGISTSHATDVHDFLFFAKSWIGVMNDSEEQHREFMDGVNQMKAYIYRVSSSGSMSEYSGSELRRIIKGFEGALMRHLREEPVQPLEIGERLRGDGLKGVWGEFEAWPIKGGMGKWDKTFFPCLNSQRRELAFVGEGWEAALDGE
ncbi:hypothetical protein BJY01DRAFT_235173 [Aspergillus pseudoustus]|uniref:Hemerythrin-like domain-containing protein n=1 Tax=Aspergillus pseudoustus TaxID=1810923 RepID=A0ABR4JXR3_9EURO